MAAWSVLRHRYKLSFFVFFSSFEIRPRTMIRRVQYKNMVCARRSTRPTAFFELLRCSSDAIHKRSVRPTKVRC